MLKQTKLTDFPTREQKIYALWHRFNMEQRILTPYPVIEELFDKGILTTRI
tara:strand:+ start:1529 stop:1681 length:153 start_codon:yes stop_codon:yes gene_type:complete